MRIFCSRNVKLNSRNECVWVRANFGFIFLCFTQFHRVPFNWKTPLGYLLVLAFYGYGMLCVVTLALPTMCLLMGTCWLFVAFAKDLTNDLHFLNINLPSNSNSLQLRGHLCKLIQLYSDIKELSWIIAACCWVFMAKFSILGPYFRCRFVEKFNLIFEIRIFMYFLWVECTICAGVLVYLKQIVEYKTHEIYIFIFNFQFFFSLFKVIACPFGMVWDELSGNFDLFHIPLDVSTVWNMRCSDQRISIVQHGIDPM